MGYCMTQRDSLFTIKAENSEGALKAIKALAETVDEQGGGGSWKGGKKKEAWYSWVTTSEFVNAKTLDDAIKAWRWVVESDKNGDINYIYFNGEKIGDDEILFNAIAPFVDDDCYIEMSGEDGALWRWAFENGELVEKNAEIIWE